MAIERGFVTIDEGQVHVRSGGDPALPVLVMFHASPGSSQSLVPLITELARYRRVVALDTLGNGDSAAPAPDAPGIAYFADAHVRALDALQIRRSDLYGTHTGAAICAEVAIRHPDRVGRIIMDGVSLFDAATQDLLIGSGHAPEIRPDLAGTQLLAAWSMVRDAHLFWPWWNRTSERRRDRGLPSADALHDEVLELLKGLRTYHKSYRAALVYPKKERLPLVRHRTLVASGPTDPLLRFLDAVVAMLPDARRLETAGNATPDALASTVRSMVEFLEHG